MRGRIADNLLAGGGEAELVEDGLDERSGLFGSPAGCAFIARGGTGGSAKNVSWDDLETGGSRAGSMLVRSETKIAIIAALENTV